MTALTDAISVLAPTAIPLVDYLAQDDGVGAYIARWNTGKLGTQPDVATIAAVTQQQVDNAKTAVLRSSAVSLTTDHGPSSKVTRAVAGTLIDEINALRDWITSFKAATAAATSLADLKTRVAALASIPNRTLAQAQTVIINKLNDGSGGVD